MTEQRVKRRRSNGGSRANRSTPNRQRVSPASNSRGVSLGPPGTGRSELPPGESPSAGASRTADAVSPSLSPSPADHFLSSLDSDGKEYLEAEIARRIAAASSVQSEVPAAGTEAPSLVALPSAVDTFLKGPEFLKLVKDHAKSWLSAHKFVLSAHEKKKDFETFLVAMGGEEDAFFTESPATLAIASASESDGPLCRMLTAYKAASPPPLITIQRKCVLGCNDALQHAASENRLQAARVQFSLVAAREKIACIDRDFELCGEHLSNADSLFKSDLGDMFGDSYEPTLRGETETRAGQAFTRACTHAQSRHSLDLQKAKKNKEKKAEQKRTGAVKAQADAALNQSSIRGFVQTTASEAAAKTVRATGQHIVPPPPGSFRSFGNAAPGPRSSNLPLWFRRSGGTVAAATDNRARHRGFAENRLPQRQFGRESSFRRGRGQ